MLASCWCLFATPARNRRARGGFRIFLTALASATLSAGGSLSGQTAEPASVRVGGWTCDPAAEVLVCEGFEAERIDPARWTIRAAAGNQVELDRRYAAAGRQSVHLHSGRGVAALALEGVFPLQPNRYWARMALRVERFSTVPWAHWTVAEAAGLGDGSLIRVGGQYRTDRGVNRWGVGSDGGPTGDWTIHDEDPAGQPTEPPVGEWVCLEWLHDGEAHRSRLFVDGVEHPSLATSSDHHGGEAVPYLMPVFRSLWFGWWQYQDDREPFEVWIDEIAVARQRVGCPG